MLEKYIDAKNNGTEYTYEQIKEFVLGYCDETVSDELMTKFIKSIYDHGMSIEATSWLTEIMMHSGDTMDLSRIPGIKVDKHSTGGVGDKVSLIVGPIVAALGAPVAKMSGRGLGFTGGTVDKLNSVPGYKTEITEDEFIDTVIKHGMSIVGQSKNLVPADKKIYALRDETGYVGSIPLGVSSIMSKKFATGADAVLLDVKCGDGAYMKTFEDAKEFAQIMVDLGKHMNKDVRAEITTMDQPLGRAIGNKNEVIESIEFLKGNSPEDLKEVIYSSASTMLVQGKIFKDEKEALVAIDEVIKSGKALAKFDEWIAAQGGDVKAIHSSDYLNPKHTFEIKADKDGYMDITSAVTFGMVAMQIGAGREKKEDDIDFNAGIYIHKKAGEQVKNGELLISLYADTPISQKNIDE